MAPQPSLGRAMRSAAVPQTSSFSCHQISIPRPLRIPARKEAPAPLRTFRTPHTPQITAYPRRRPGSALPCARPRAAPSEQSPAADQRLQLCFLAPCPDSWTHAAVKRIPCHVHTAAGQLIPFHPTVGDVEDGKGQLGRAGGDTQSCERGDGAGLTPGQPRALRETRQDAVLHRTHGELQLPTCPWLRTAAPRTPRVTGLQLPASPAAPQLPPPLPHATPSASP